jgi:3-phosphoshikimate 1-carboxyvinyltransferase
MEKITLSKSAGIRGDITVPGDKSITHRAVIFGSIAKGVTRVKGFLSGEDNLRTIDAFKMMGVDVKTDKDELLITGAGLHGLKEPDDVIYAGNSGTTARLMLGLLSGQNFFSVITGDKYLRKRPMGRIVEPLLKSGAEITGRAGAKLLPISVSPGRITPIRHDMKIASAQLKSALILAGMYSGGENIIKEPAPSRNHTENMLCSMGVNLEAEDNTIRFDAGQELSAIDIEVPGDISSAAFFIVAATIIKGSELLIKNIGINPTRTGIIDVLKDMGADITFESHRTVSGEDVADIVVRPSELKGIEIGGSAIPKTIDEFPIISLAAAMASGVTKIRDAAELRVKESDRIAATAENLKKLGVEVTQYDDGMDIKGSGRLKGSDDLKSFGDHRIAMMLCIAALAADEPCTINDIECVDTSFPDFFKLLQSIR